LIRGWATVSFEPDFFDEHGRWRGLLVESFVLERKLDWKPYLMVGLRWIMWHFGC
jgi:hypothetical protein